MNHFDRDKFVIRIWVKKEEFESSNVMNVLVDNKTIEDSINEIAKKINAFTVFDIYYV